MMERYRMTWRNCFSIVPVAILAWGIASLSGCAGKKIVESVQPPDWVTKGSAAFEDGGGKIFHGVGGVTGVRNKPLATTAADNRARAEVSKLFQFYTASLMKDYAASTIGGARLRKHQTHLKNSMSSRRSRRFHRQPYPVS